MLRNARAVALIAASALSWAPLEVRALSGAGAQPPAKKREGVHEGMFLTARPGGLLRVSTGDWVFVPQQSAQGIELRPMVLLPSQTLTRLASGAQTVLGQAAGVVSGQVFVYRGREYLLPTAYRIIAPEEINRTPTSLPSDAPADKQTPASGGKQANAEADEARGAASVTGTESPSQLQPIPKDLASDPSVEELVRDLEARKTQPRSLTPRVSAPDRKASPGTPTTPEAEPKAGVGERTAGNDMAVETLPEGKLITSMRGRVARTGEGELAFFRDGDSDSPTGGPMVLLPCQTLQSLEDLTAWRGESLILEVSGRVFEFENRRYLLPTLFVVQPPSETRPTQ